MKILYLINYAGSGGSEAYTLKLAKHLWSNGARVFFAYNIDGPLTSEMSLICEKTLRLEMRSPFDFKAARMLSEFIQENGIELVHAQYPRENYIAVLAKSFRKGLKIIYTSHTNFSDGAARRVLNRVFTRGDDAVVAVGTESVGILRRNGYPASKITLIFNGVDADVSGETNHLPPDIEIPADGFVFFSAARLSHEKGIDFLAEAASELKKLTDRQFSVLVAGDGGERERLEALIRGLGVEDRVFLLGYRSDCGAIMRGSDAYICPSRSECFGFAPLEAMARSLPVIATDVGGNRDIVNAETDCGIRVPFGDTRALAEAMLSLMTCPGERERLGRNAARAASELFSDGIFFAQTMKLYDKVLKGE